MTAERPLEEGVRRDFRQAMSYGDYLGLDAVLSAQHPLADPPQHDELLFIIQHQTSELWLKLMLHELRAARANLAGDRLSDALKQLARVKHIQSTLTEQWTVLATLTPSEYAQFRDFLATSSGFQSHQYRAVEFLLGNKNASMIPVFDHDPDAQQMLQQLLDEPSLYDAFIALLSRRGLDVPADLLDRDWSVSRGTHQGLIEVVHQIYADPHAHWEAYETCEELVDLEDNFQLWRFRHLRTVERIIGTAPGTGGSSGVPFLRKALEQSFFPELYAVRGEIAQGR